MSEMINDVQETVVDAVVEKVNDPSLIERLFSNRAVADAATVVAVIGGGLYLVEKTYNGIRYHLVPYAKDKIAEVQKKMEEAKEAKENAVKVNPDGSIEGDLKDAK